jgi:hypothetical protein
MKVADITPAATWQQRKFRNAALRAMRKAQGHNSD